MADTQATSDQVRILPPDRSLMRKLGNINLDQVFSTQVVEAAQKVIADSSDTLFAETLTNAQQLETISKTLRAQPEKLPSLLPEIIATSFSMKSSAGMASYDLISSLAKSLNWVCESLDPKSLTSTHSQIILWHMDSLHKIVALKVKGAGGPAGEALQKELAAIEKMFGKDKTDTVPVL